MHFKSDATQKTCAPKCNNGYDLIGVSKCVEVNLLSAVCTPGKCKPVTVPSNGTID